MHPDSTHSEEIINSTSDIIVPAHEKYSTIDTNLFEFNPLPTWIYDKKSLKIIRVNEAAIKAYGYSKSEFLEMTIKDIRPTDEIKKLEEVCEHSPVQRNYFQAMFKHRKKNGDIITVDIYSDPIVINGKSAKIVIITDITPPATHIAFIEKQNAALQQIAQLQSHGVRAPLARIMACVEILTNPHLCSNDQPPILSILEHSSKDLDALIRQIITLTTSESVDNRFIPKINSFDSLRIVNPKKENANQTS